MLYPRLFGFPTMRSSHPYDELTRMRRQMDRIMDSVYSRPSTATYSGVFPAINVSEDTDYFYVRAELPGVQAGDLDIQTTANNLTISGERKLAAEEQSAKYHRREREGGRFSRAFTLPKEIDVERVEAGLVNGILTLRLPKAQSAKPKRIAIGG
jgi:HSP20 family protein